MLTDANGEERKGIETDMLAATSKPHVRIWWTAKPADCWLIACGVPYYGVGLSEREYETIRDLMLAGF